MKRKVLILFISIILVSALAGWIAACAYSLPDPEKIKETGRFVEAIDIEDYGNGVYYFPRYEKEFGYALSDFIGKHSDLDLATMAIATGGDGQTKGYFVVFRKK